MDEKAIKIPLTLMGIISEIVALIGLLLPIIYMAAVWSTIPDIVPTHFGLSGQANAWGSKGSLLGLVGISIFIYILLTVTSKFPRAYNFPWPITEQNVEVQYKIGRSMVQTLKAEVLWIFAYINWISVQGALKKGMALGTAFLLVSFLLVFGTIGIYISRAFRANSAICLSENNVGLK